MMSNSGTLLSRVLEAVTKPPGPRMEKLQKIAAALRETAGFRWVGLYDIDHVKDEVINLAWDGPATPEYPVFPIGKGLTGKVIVEKRIVNVGDVSADPRYLTALGSTRSEIIVPILNDETCSSPDYTRRQRSVHVSYPQSGALC
jgi:L-methionine (R)-S-oxide reductase